MHAHPRRRLPARAIELDRSLEPLPLFRLADSAEDAAVAYTDGGGARWRVIPYPGDRLPGTFDQDVYVELVRRFHDTGKPADGVVSFTLHNFLRSIGRRVDGRTYEQLRSALVRLHRTTLESTGLYWDARIAAPLHGSFALLSAIRIDRRRTADREQLGLFPALPANEPGEARVTLASQMRANIAAGHTSTLNPGQYLALSSPVSRRLYRLICVARAEGREGWAVPLGELAELLPLAQRYPSHLQRVLQPAHEMLVSAGIVETADVSQDCGNWRVRYVFAARAA
jgi:plasmid replication initiation protein